MPTDINTFTRRRFLRHSGAFTGVVALGQAGLPAVLGARVGSDKIRVGLVGCGARGTNAARMAQTAAPGVEVVALADLFQVQVDAIKEKLKLPDVATFTGFDAYRNIFSVDLDVVLLATPPGFRPLHFAAAVAAGKHVFIEKPVAVDPAGCRAVIETTRLAAQKGLAVVAGTQRRHSPDYIETIKRIQNGAIGDLVAGQCYWNSTGIWFREKKDWIAEFTDFEWQCWNWYHWGWLSGDHIVEQHIHNIDVMNWAFGGPPAKLYGMGGRQNRGNLPGDIWDHFAVEMEYPNGARVTSMSRQAPKSTTRVGERVVGTRGVSDCKSVIMGERPFNYAGPTPNAQVQELSNLFNSMRSGNLINEGEQVAFSTLTAIGGRMAAYTGREISWRWLLEGSKLDIFPKSPGPGPGIFTPVPMPGQTELI